MKICNLIFLLLITVFSFNISAVGIEKNHNAPSLNQAQVKPKLLFLAGSARKESVNKMLAHKAYQIAKKAGANATFIDLKNYPLPIYDGDLETNQGLPENVLALKKIFAEHDGIFIASPEYNSSISPLLKNTLDWVSRDNASTAAYNKVYKNKVIVLSSASPSEIGGMRGLMHLQIVLGDMGAIINPKKMTLSNAYDKFNKEGYLIKAENYQELAGVVTEFIHLSTVVKNNLK